MVKRIRLIELRALYVVAVAALVLSIWSRYRIAAVIFLIAGAVQALCLVVDFALWIGERRSGYGT